MKAVYTPTGEVVEVEGPSESGVFTRVSFNGSSQFVATGCLSVIEDAPKPPPKESKPRESTKEPSSRRPPDEVTLFLREMENEEDLRNVCKDIGIDYPVRTSFGLTKMAIGNVLRKLIKNGEYELSWA